MKIRIWLSTLLLVLTGIMVAACGGQTPPATVPMPSSTPLLTPTVPADAPTGTVTLVTSGGIAGVRRTLTIKADGKATLLDRDKEVGTAQLTSAQLGELWAKLGAVDFFNLKERYGEGTVSDDFELSLTFDSGGRSKTVVMEEIGGEKVTPQPVRELFGMLSAIERQIGTVTPTSSTSIGKLLLGGTVTYETSDTSPGLLRELTINPNGVATLTVGLEMVGTSQLPPESLQPIRAKMEVANFLNLEERYGTGQVSDDTISTITLESGSVQKRVMVERVGGRGITPKEVLDLFALLDTTEAEVRTRIMATP